MLKFVLTYLLAFYVAFKELKNNASFLCLYSTWSIMIIKRRFVPTSHWIEIKDGNQANKIC